MVQTAKNLPATWESWIWSLGREDLPEKEMATHSSILAWEIPRTEDPGGLQSMGSQKSWTRLNDLTDPNHALPGVWTPAQLSRDVVTVAAACCCLVLRSCLWLLCDPTLPARFLRSWSFPDKSTGAGFHFLLQGIFPTQGSKLPLLYWQADSTAMGKPQGNKQTLYLSGLWMRKSSGTHSCC